MAVPAGMREARECLRSRSRADSAQRARSLLARVALARMGHGRAQPSPPLRHFPGPLTPAFHVALTSGVNTQARWLFRYSCQQIRKLSLSSTVLRVSARHGQDD